MRLLRALTAGLVVLATLAVLTVGLVDPALSQRLGMGDWGQAGAEAVAAAACSIAAARTRSRARLVWGLFAAGLSIWAVTDGLYAFAGLRGWDVGEVSLFDVGWLAFYAPMLGGAFLLYLRLRPERGWQGVLDGLLLSTAVAAAGWKFVVEPTAAQAPGGVAGALVAILYPLLDLSCLLALAWVVLRQRTRAPVWLRWVAAAFACQAVAGLAYVGATVHDRDLEAVSAAMFMVSAGAWTMAALTRAAVAESRPWHASRHDAPPPWSESVPFMVGAAIVGLSAIATTSPELQAAAVVAGLIMAIRAIDALAVRRSLLADRDRLLVTDPLTGTYNRRFLNKEADRVFARARRGEEAVSAIALDLDGFKAVNDRFGHGAGDDLLREVADAIGRDLRLGDLLCRLGGDEFLVLCPATEDGGARELAERIRERVRAAAHALVPEQPVTVSAGIATYPGDAADPAELMRLADIALYAGKRAGRDRVVALTDIAGDEGVGTVAERHRAPTRA
ncbi:MAG TPA: GGDEF domain-containing protein [Miltoncostaeaceae bacterium]|nr:GGDEF domain-containing protein [Miltoncostaeaceae bacterium]